MPNTEIVIERDEKGVEQLTLDARTRESLARHLKGKTWTIMRTDDERRPEPTAVDGVHRSRALARMTGGESLLLTHPVLRRLWRARFAEAQLLTYDDRAREPRPHPRPRPEGAAAPIALASRCSVKPGRVLVGWSSSTPRSTTRWIDLS